MGGLKHQKNVMTACVYSTIIKHLILGVWGGSWKERPIAHFQIKSVKTFRNVLNRTSIGLADNRLDEPAGLFSFELGFQT